MKYRRRSKGDGRRMKTDVDSALNRVKSHVKAKRRALLAQKVTTDPRFDGGVAKKFLCDEEGR